MPLQGKEESLQGVGACDETEVTGSMLAQLCLHTRATQGALNNGKPAPAPAPDQLKPNTGGTARLLQLLTR